MHPLDRAVVAPATEVLWEFLGKFGLTTLAECGTAAGGWVLEDDEDGPDLRVLPDLPDYLENLAQIALGRHPPYGGHFIFPCGVVGSERRIWLAIYYEHPGEGWVYEYPEARDDRDLEQWRADDAAHDLAIAAAAHPWWLLW